MSSWSRRSLDQFNPFSIVVFCFHTQSVITFVFSFTFFARLFTISYSHSKLNSKFRYVDILTSNHLKGGVTIVVLRESKGSTFHVLCVNCSIFDFTSPSPRSLPFLTIQSIFPILLITFNVALIEGERFGIFGAGGNVGRFKSMLGINEGSSGSVGGAGSVGILGIFRSRFADIFPQGPGSAGTSGRSGSSILLGTKRIFGSITSIHMFMLLKSM